MSLLREFPERGLSRRFGFRAFHRGLKKIVDVRSCSFESTSGEALVSLKTEPKLVFRAFMRELVLLEDTSRTDSKGSPIYEGDRIRANVQNEWGSFEVKEGNVVFDEDKWGFMVDFDLNQAIDITGVITDVEVIGSMFELQDEFTQATKNKATL